MNTTYLDQVKITAQAAQGTAKLCYRKGRRDVHRLHALATHPTTVRGTQIALWTLFVGGVIAFACGQTARILVQSWVDDQVASALPRPVAPAPAQVAPVGIPSVAKLLEQAEVMAHPDPAAIAAPVATLTIPVEATAEATTTDYSQMSSRELRKLCTAKGIKWAHQRGHNHHMTCRDMAAAIAAVG